LKVEVQLNRIHVCGVDGVVVVVVVVCDGDGNGSAVGSMLGIFIREGIKCKYSCLWCWYRKHGMG
jgi:hypothetical protein